MPLQSVKSNYSEALRMKKHKDSTSRHNGQSTPNTAFSSGRGPRSWNMIWLQIVSALSNITTLAYLTMRSLYMTRSKETSPAIVALLWIEMAVQSELISLFSAPFSDELCSTTTRDTLGGGWHGWRRQGRTSNRSVDRDLCTSTGRHFHYLLRRGG